MGDVAGLFTNPSNAPHDVRKSLSDAFFCSFLLPFAFVFQHVYRAEKALFYCSTADYYEKVLSLSKLAMLLDKSLDLLG